MRIISAFLITLGLFAALPTLAQKAQPTNTTSGVAESKADQAKVDTELEADKKAARKARREHRKMVNHRQRHRH